jgi:DNA-binding NarL/FixJ family response regulator
MSAGITVRVEVPGGLGVALALLITQNQGIAITDAEETVVLLSAEADWRAALEQGRVQRGPPAVLVTHGRYHELAAAALLSIQAFYDLADPAEELLQAIRSAAERQAFYSRSIHPMLLQMLRTRTAVDPDLPSAALTRREEQVVRLAAARLSNREIARRLSVTVATVKSHVHAGLKKLGASQREELLPLLQADADVVEAAAGRLRKFNPESHP